MKKNQSIRTKKKINPKEGDLNGLFLHLGKQKFQPLDISEMVQCINFQTCITVPAEWRENSSVVTTVFELSPEISLTTQF